LPPLIFVKFHTSFHLSVEPKDAAIRRGIPAELLTDAPAHLVAAPGIDVVVELMGGGEPARTILAAALGAGRAVVTANKHVLAHHGAELEEAARRTDAPFRFEAAVGGGIPVLAPLSRDLAANDVVRVRGIVNGTTNYLLTEMAEHGMAYADALAAAQAAGYAEVDPAADVEGIDAANKLVVLARLAFGAWLDPLAIPRATPDGTGGAGTAGITGVTLADLGAASERGLVLRLVAEAVAAGEGRGRTVAAGVRTVAVAVDSPLGRTRGIENRIEIDAEPVGRIAVEGPGAGGGPTSSAVAADLRAIARGEGSTWAGLRQPRSAPRLAALPDPPGGWLDAPGGARYPILD
jgi:homoserine dehydrogenase